MHKGDGNMKKYISPSAEFVRFQSEEVLGASDLVLIRPGESSGVGGNDDETEFLPNSNVNGFR